MSGCDACLRRTHLLGLLAPRIAGLLDRPRSRSQGLLTLPDETLIAAVAGSRAGDVRSGLDRFEPAAQRARMDALGIAALCRHDSSYPKALCDLADPPAMLHLRGEMAAGEPAVAVVGTRDASPYGLEVAYELGRSLAVAGVTVVSGLALGVDAAAHRGCLDGGGRPLAVVAGGVDVPYPRQNERLYERVAEDGGVVSELPPGGRPFRWSFPARNRIMAGLAQMTVLVEAADPSGSLITADFARDMGRTVGAVPGRITSRVAVGTNRLLRDGAVPVTGVQDVLDELFGAGARAADSPQRLPELDATAREVLDGVESGSSLGQVAQAAGIPVSEARAALSRLESQGLIVRAGLGSWERTARA